uniref:G_PROTEIN_RECEP_F1_2 domain-containing protein n=2 Tax=Panagrellus redivivus TaxID=6233 RepID=A0A7E4WBP2_PANRE
MATSAVNSSSVPFIIDLFEFIAYFNSTDGTAAPQDSMTLITPRELIHCDPPPPQNNGTETHDPFLLDHIIYSIFIPIVSGIGVFAAFICVVVFTRPQMRSSLNIYLAGLSFFDLVLLAMSLLIYPPMSICLKTSSGMVCQFFWKTALVTFPLSLAAQTASVWTCVAITVDRFLAVQYPLKMRVWCTPAKAFAIIVVIATISFLYKMPSIFELKLDECGKLVPTELRKNELYIVVYNTYGYLLLLIVIPWTLMIILNVIVVRAVHCAYQIRRSMTKTIGRVDDRERRCTVMALVILSTFILFNLLAGINNIIEAFYDSPSFYRFRIPIGNLLVCVNSASNILIYSIFGRKFRRVCFQLLCPCMTDRGYQWLQPTMAIPSEAGESLRKITVLMPESTSACPSRGNSLRMVHIGNGSPTTGIPNRKSSSKRSFNNMIAKRSKSSG